MLQRYTATMLDLLAGLVVSNTTKIVLLSLDGLAGLPHLKTGRSEMETASLPNLDALATEAACGLLRHVAPGITPGSGPPGSAAGHNRRARGARGHCPV